MKLKVLALMRLLKMIKYWLVKNNFLKCKSKIKKSIKNFKKKNLKLKDFFKKSNN